VTESAEQPVEAPDAMGPEETEAEETSYAEQPVGPPIPPSLAKAVRKYKLTFSLRGGKLARKYKRLDGKVTKKGRRKIASIKLSSGAKLGKLPKLIRKGYRFKGWYVKEKAGRSVKGSVKRSVKWKKVKKTTRVMKNMKVYAKWKKR
jgi:uncharacterized repeat protein (TIGR02543 family)